MLEEPLLEKLAVQQVDLRRVHRPAVRRDATVHLLMDAGKQLGG